MKIPLGGGVFLEAEPGEDPRHAPYHRRMVRCERIPDTRAGHRIVLDCGHHTMAFGDLKRARGVVFCSQCRDGEKAGTE